LGAIVRVAIGLAISEGGTGKGGKPFAFEEISFCIEPFSVAKVLAAPSKFK
jgi:hypothetical protein